MSAWLRQLRVDPLSALLALADEMSAGEAICYFVRRDLLAEPVGPVQVLWEIPEAQNLVSKQQMDGSWRYPGRNRLLRRSPPRLRDRHLVPASRWMCSTESRPVPGSSRVLNLHPGRRSRRYSCTRR